MIIRSGNDSIRFIDEDLDERLKCKTPACGQGRHIRPSILDDTRAYVLIISKVMLKNIIECRQYIIMSIHINLAGFRRALEWEIRGKIS